MNSYRVAIIGAGFSGICMAIRLQRAKMDSFIVFEKAREAGGTWRDNVYPGVACDVPSHLYCYSFEPNPEWSREYAPGSEIKEYLNDCVGKYGLARKIRLGTRVLEARYHEGTWELTCDSGEKVRCELLVGAMGGLHHPHVPDIPGIPAFAGTSFHTSGWDREADLRGKRIAVVGTGASAVQCIPHLAECASHLTVFQRTPIWVMPKRDPQFSDEDKQRFRRSRVWRRLYRFRIWRAWERFGVDVIRDTERNRHLQEVATRFIHKQVRDPALAAKLTPGYRYGCKRPTLSNDYYRTFNRDNVELVTDPLAAVEPGGIRTESGRLVPADVIVWATGFRAFDITADITMFGRDGTRLSEAWRERITSYRTVMVPGFPNFVIMLGPNSGGLTSAIQMIEAQAGFVVRLLRFMGRKRLVAVEPKVEVTRSWNRRLQESFQKTLANAGCHSWWTDASGNNHTQYPHSSARYRLELAYLRSGEFDLHRS